MPKISCGLVMVDARARVLLVHPGGPFYKRRDAGIWSIPKGLSEPGEALVDAARREFREELGFDPEAKELYPLGDVKQSGGKVVHAWAFQGEWDPSLIQSITFELEWPPNSGKREVFPEVDRAAFFEEAVAREKVIAAQWPLLERAIAWARGREPSPPGAQ
ncbi:MAG TPA: NUDIX domain-containing protein [Polyangiaceae bacterium]|nr:NUDIX domain-containing protein [Polyangiaceae bacterium]